MLWMESKLWPGMQSHERGGHEADPIIQEQTEIPQYQNCEMGRENEGDNRDGAHEDSRERTARSA